MPFYLVVPALLAESQQIISHGWPGLVSIHLEVCLFQFFFLWLITKFLLNHDHSLSDVNI